MNKYKVKKYLRQYPELFSADPGKKRTFISDDEIPEINWFAEKNRELFKLPSKKYRENKKR